MILYEGTATEFSEAVEKNQLIKSLEDVFRNKLGRSLPPAERSAYTNSLSYMERVVRRSGIAGDCGILIEYIIPLTSNRIDFLIAGEDEMGNKNFIIVELKQWQQAEVAYGDGIVSTILGGGIRETTHPSYQATSYKQFLSDFNENITNGDLKAYSCAYLHNYEKKDPEPLLSEIYQDVVEQSPLYFRDDQQKLEDFLAKYVKNGNGSEILYQIESSKIKPSKKLIEHVSACLMETRNLYCLMNRKLLSKRQEALRKTPMKNQLLLLKADPELENLLFL